MTVNELQILLALNGNTRIDYAEEEIFASEELYTCYLESLCSEYPWWYGNYNKDDSGGVTYLAYCYAYFIINDRWPEAEPVIATSPKSAYMYAKCVIKCRWLEAESVIATNHRWAAYYAKNVIKGRFAEAESVITMGLQYVKWYNREFCTKI